MSMRLSQLVEIGGERREALFGVGPQHIRVMETHNLKVSKPLLLKAGGSLVAAGIGRIFDRELNPFSFPFSMCLCFRMNGDSQHIMYCVEVEISIH